MIIFERKICVIARIRTTDLQFSILAAYPIRPLWHVKQRKGWRMSSAKTITMSSAHSPTFQSLHLRHSSLSNPSVALSTSQLILHPLRCFTYVTAHSPTLLSLLLSHKLFIYVTWQAAHSKDEYFNDIKIPSGISHITIRQVHRTWTPLVQDIRVEKFYQIIQFSALLTASSNSHLVPQSSCSSSQLY